MVLLYFVLIFKLEGDLIEIAQKYFLGTLRTSFIKHYLYPVQFSCEYSFSADSKEVAVASYGNLCRSTCLHIYIIEWETQIWNQSLVVCF
jgi:hypothetical protein